MSNDNVDPNGRNFSELTNDEKAEIGCMYQDGEPIVEIARAFRLKYPADVSHTAKILGLPLRHSFTKQPTNGVEKPKAKSIDEQLADLEAQAVELQTKRRELEALKEAKAIKFEWRDNTSIMCLGVTEHFIRNEGLAKLRKFIEERIPQKGITS